MISLHAAVYRAGNLEEIDAGGGIHMGAAPMTAGNMLANILITLPLGR